MLLIVNINYVTSGYQLLYDHLYISCLCNILLNKKVDENVEPLNRDNITIN